MSELRPYIGRWECGHRERLIRNLKQFYYDDTNINVKYIARETTLFSEDFGIIDRM